MAARTMPRAKPKIAFLVGLEEWGRAGGGGVDLPVAGVTKRKLRAQLVDAIDQVLDLQGFRRGRGDRFFGRPQLLVGAGEGNLDVLAVARFAQAQIDLNVGVGEVRGGLAGAGGGRDQDEVAAFGGGSRDTAASRLGLSFLQQAPLDGGSDDAGIDQHHLVGDAAIGFGGGGLAVTEQRLDFGAAAQVDAGRGAVDLGLVVVVEVGYDPNQDPHEEDQPLAFPEGGEDLGGV